MDHGITTFACGCAVSAEIVVAAKELDSLVEKGKENCGFVAFLRGDWYKYQFAGAWTAIAMATIQPKGKDRTVVAVSPGGAYWEVDTKSRQEANGGIDTATASLRSLGVVDDAIYACGMGRSVLKRTGIGVWNEIGPGTSQKEKGRVVGFEGLAGFSADDIYAVGWMGEIWQRRKTKWRRIDSPTSANLNAVCSAPDGQVYIVGDGGAMLRGRDDRWEVIETGRTDNLMDVAFHGKSVYVSTDFEILTLNDNSLVADDAFADAEDLPATCLHLLPAGDALFSMGTKDLFRLREGTWARLV